MSKKRDEAVTTGGIRDKLLKNTTIKTTALLSDSVYFKSQGAPIATSVPMINVALSGSMKGGLRSGLLQLAGPSKHFKTGFGLLVVQAFLKQHPDGMILFYDSEFGSPLSYFDAYQIPHDSVVHTPVTSLEELRTDVVNQLAGLDRKDKVLIFLDSLGMLASMKETDDAAEGKNKADFTRAKTIKSLFRIVSPKLSMLDVPMIVINHTYKTMDLYPQDVIGGGTGSVLAANDIWVLGRRQEKEDDEIAGYSFVISIYKSRFIREKSKIAIKITHEHGIHRWSGFWEEATDAGIIVAGEKKGQYNFIDPDTGEVHSGPFKQSDVEDEDSFWLSVLKRSNLEQIVKDKYTLGSAGVITGEELVEESDA